MENYNLLGGKKYVNSDDPEFYKFINKYYTNYEISPKKRTFDQICFPKKYELQIPQKFLAEYINPKTPYDSMLVVHKIGAGKTCASIRVGEAWKKDRKIIVLLPASLKGNYYNELRSECVGSEYLSKENREKLKVLSSSDPEYNDILSKSIDEIHKYYEIYSYNKFVELYKRKKITLNGKLLIVDEIQNMVSEGGSFYESLYNAIKTAKNLRIVLLSATPIFDKPHEIALTLNLLNLKTLLPIGKEFYNMFIEKNYKSNGEVVYSVKNMDYFKKTIRGFVSYYRGAPTYTFPEMRFHYTNCVMEHFQLKSYLTVINTEQTESNKNEQLNKIFHEGEIMDLPSNFFLGTRIISNIAFPNLGISEQGFKSLSKANVGELEKLKKYSIKFYKILKKLKISKGPVFFYSNFKGYGGIESFMKILEIYGYKNYVDHGEGKRRFAVWSGDIRPKTREDIRNIFNKVSNTDGSHIKIILGSPSMKEGVSLFRVKQVHILEPYWNQSRIDQIIGRAVRFCSHKDLPEEERYVEVFVYIATHPDISISVDEHIQKLALKKHELNSEFDKALKEAAIDCKLFKNANMDLDEHGKPINNYECDK